MPARARATTLFALEPSRGTFSRAHAPACRHAHQDLAAGELVGSALDSFRTLMSDLYLPILREQDQAWGVAPEEAAGDFLQARARTLRRTAARVPECSVHARARVRRSARLLTCHARATTARGRNA
jgi:hypothetical protein